MTGYKRAGRVGETGGLVFWHWFELPPNGEIMPIYVSLCASHTLLADEITEKIEGRWPCVSCEQAMKKKAKREESDGII